jgi:SAM-dependent methyltransferase
MKRRKIDLSDLNGAFRRFASDLLVRMRMDPGSYCYEIAPRDEMFFNAIMPGYGNEPNISYFKYIESALRTFDIYRQLIDSYAGGFANIRGVLDFGSGYGRLTRSLVQHLPREKIWVADIYESAMTWQKERFAVNTVNSVNDPDRFALNQSFSVVFAGSVFSHLPDALFQRWLNRLYGLTAPDGIFVFSVHGEALLPAGERLGPEGIRYLAFSESATLPTDVYGMTYVSGDYVAASIARLDPTRHVQFRRFPRSLYENQDLYVVAGASVDLREIALTIPLLGGFELVSGPAEGAIEFYGWAVDFNRGHQVTRFEVFCDEQSIHVGAPTPDADRLWHYFPGAPNIPVGWRFSLPAGLRHPERVIRVEFYSSSGAVGYAYASIPDGEVNPTSMRGLLT